MTALRRKAVEGIRPGDRFVLTRTFDRPDTEVFARITRDYNPVHFDDRFSSAKKFEGTICHGLLVGSMITEIGGQVGWLATGMAFKFKRPVYPGETIRCEMVITRVDRNRSAAAEAVLTNQDGIVVMEAELSGFLPGEPERAVLREMMAEGDPTNGCG